MNVPGPQAGRTDSDAQAERRACRSPSSVPVGLGPGSGGPAAPGQLCGLKCLLRGVLSLPAPYSGPLSSFTLAVKPRGPRGVAGSWTAFLRRAACGFAILPWPGPVALPLCGLFWTPRERGAGRALLRAARLQAWALGHCPGFLVWPRLSASRPGLGAGVWGKGSGCCNLCDNKSASAHRLRRGCGVCLWAREAGLVEGV